MSVHFAIDELADAAGGVLDDERTRQVEAHVRQCPTCTETWAALSEVTAQLGAEPAPAMPPEVAARLQGLLAEQSRQRSLAAPHADPTPHLPALITDARSSATRPDPRPTLGTFGADLSRRPGSGFWVRVAAAAVAAGIVGFAGYFLSASVGLNEPPAATPAVVSSGRLGPEARSLSQHGDLSPHRFSRAWQCARDVTEGRIVAITSAVVDGQPALLVYTKNNGVQQVTVVTGCVTADPVAGPSTALSR